MNTQSAQSAIQTVDEIIHAAVAHRASDIHCETAINGVRVRWRIDGMLYEKSFIDASLGSQVISRIKVLAHINIAERRVPHDGKFTVEIDGKPVDLRVSTFPSIHGEKVVVRILDRATHMIELDQLGLSEPMLAAFRQLLNKSSGFFLVAGPTGSGKTTTLYAALSYLNAPEKNIITLEDPVEYDVSGVTQGQINPDAGFTFQRGLRALLRQDPDIVMVGEMRDAETAQIAIEASLTGHVVLSTIHTNDAPSVIMRLIDMGIEPFLINAALSGVLAQRLARTICPECKVRVEPSRDEQALLAKLGKSDCKLYRGNGCDACMNLGYKGRIGLFELLVMTPAMRLLVMQRPSFDYLVEQAAKDGMRTLLLDGLEKVDEGLITLQELVRVAL